MRRIWQILNIPRSIIVFILYIGSNYKSEIDLDLDRNNKKHSVYDIHLAMLSGGCFRNLFYYRTNKEHPLLTKLCKLFYRPFFGLEIDAEKLDGGMIIYHGYSTIVFAKSIGKNFTTYQQVTIGRGKKIDGNDIPIIGDNVTVCAGAIIVGGVHIGDNVTIGTGAVVVRDVPPNSVVVGSSARIIDKSGSVECE